MKNNRLNVILVLILFMLLVSACGNSTEESNATVDKPTENTDSTDSSSNSTPSSNPSKNESTDDTEKSSGNVDEDLETEENSLTNDTVSKKEEYLNRLVEMKEETEEKRKNTEDANTYELKAIEGELFDLWDGMLNEIYGVLKEQLPSDEMDAVRKEQRAWIDKRDRTAKEASLKYEGGTMEHLEYTVVLNNLTQERCFELVEDYMK